MHDAARVNPFFCTILDVNEAISDATAADVPARSNFPQVTQTELCINLLLFWQRAAVNLFITKTPALPPRSPGEARRGLAVCRLIPASS